MLTVNVCSTFPDAILTNLHRGQIMLLRSFGVGIRYSFAPEPLLPTPFAPTKGSASTGAAKRFRVQPVAGCLGGMTLRALRFVARCLAGGGGPLPSVRGTPQAATRRPVVLSLLPAILRPAKELLYIRYRGDGTIRTPAGGRTEQFGTAFGVFRSAARRKKWVTRDKSTQSEGDYKKIYHFICAITGKYVLLCCEKNNDRFFQQINISIYGNY